VNLVTAGLTVPAKFIPFCHYEGVPSFINAEFKDKEQILTDLATQLIMIAIGHDNNKIMMQCVYLCI
jgi:hypothetical protein